MTVTINRLTSVVGVYPSGEQFTVSPSGGFFPVSSNALDNIQNYNLGISSNSVQQNNYLYGISSNIISIRDHLYSISANTLIDSGRYAVRVDYDANNNAIYAGWAVAGTVGGTAAWRVVKYTYDTNNNMISSQFADGDSLFNNVWANRVALSYT